jgi:3-hydroxybutyrate dehydrogenase
MSSGKVAVVTGSTSGIGLAIAHALAAEGARIVINSFSDGKEDHALAAELAEKHATDVVYMKADMARPQDCRALVDRAAEHFGSLDILVNNAGIQHVCPIEDFPPEQWDRIIAINLTSNFHTIAAAIPHMKKSGWGRIVNIASAHGLRASVDKSAYVAAKHGVVGLTKTVALEQARNGITCNAVCPGFVHTPLVEIQVKDQMKAHPKLDRETVIHDVILAKQPTKEFATVDQIAAATAFLCSAQAAQITGTTLSVDGGWTAQ